MQYQNTGVNHPSHYKHKSGLDAIVWIDRYNMDFSVGSCFKYLFRCGLKEGEPLDKDHEKAIWYFVHAARKCADGSSLLTWEDAKRKVFEKLSFAFGPPGRMLDENGQTVPDWTKGGCDMPDAVEFLKVNCMTALKD